MHRRFGSHLAQPIIKPFSCKNFDIIVPLKLELDLLDLSALVGSCCADTNRPIVR
jgi:hypothetical protein